MGFMWFGTRNKMQWVKAPAVSLDASKVDWNTQTNFLNGGASVRRSLASHKEYNFAWDMTSRDNIRVIQDYADGIYGTDAIYFADPFAMDKNLLPSYWAAPFMGATDGINLNGTNTALPTLTPTVINSLGYPTNSAVYTVSGSAQNKVWIPIPTGYQLWVGVHGVNGTGGTVVATPTTGATTIGTPVTLTMLPTTTNQRVNQSFSGASYDGVLLALGGSGTVTLSGIIVQLIPDAVPPLAGGFISGQGNSGCLFAAQPTLTLYNAPMDLVGLTAKLVETKAWQ